MERRQTRYLMRRWCHVDPDEPMPWWKERELIEGIRWEWGGLRIDNSAVDDLDTLESKGYTVRRKG